MTETVIRLTNKNRLPLPIADIVSPDVSPFRCEDDTPSGWVDKVGWGEGNSRLAAAGHLGKSNGLCGAGAPLLRTGADRAGEHNATALTVPRERYRVKAEGRTPQAAKVLATGQWSAPAGGVGLGKLSPMGGYRHTRCTGRRGDSPRRCCRCFSSPI